MLAEITDPTSTSDFDGKTGELLKYDSVSDMWHVSLINEKADMHCKPENLNVIGPTRCKRPPPCKDIIAEPAIQGIGSDASGSDSPTDDEDREATRPPFDHAAAGYLMHIDCGHNGVMTDVDLLQLRMHV